MHDVRQELRQMMGTARALHGQERAVTIQSVELIGRLDRRNAPVNAGMTAAQFAQAIGLTPSQYFKRVQAARVLWRFPRAAEMLASGETEVSHLSAAYGKITDKNQDMILDGIRGKSKREAEAFLSRVTLDGRLLEREGEVEIRLILTESQLGLLARAREILAARGHVPGDAEIFVKALAELIERRDPLKKAERAAKRAAAAAAPGQQNERRSAVVPPPTAPGQQEDLPKPCPDGGGLGQQRRQPIPASIRHAVMLRDQRQCVEVLADGSRCPERVMVELDHIVPVCRGGQHSLENLVCRCRHHNRARAEQQIGAGYMVSWEKSRERAAAAAELAARQTLSTARDNLL